MSWILRQISDIGRNYRDRNKLDEAEKLLTRALSSYEKLNGIDDPSTLGVAFLQATVYLSQEKLTEAESTFSRTHKGFEKTLGPYHTQTLDAINYLGFIYFRERRDDEAKRFLKSALDKSQDPLGRAFDRMDAKRMIFTTHKLAQIYFDQNKLDKAEKMAMRALDECLKLWSWDDHEVAVGIAYDLGLIFYSQGKHGEEAQRTLTCELDAHLDLFHTCKDMLAYKINENLTSIYKGKSKLQRSTKHPRSLSWTG